MRLKLYIDRFQGPRSFVLVDPGSTTVLTSSYRISMDFSLEYIYPDTRCMPYMPPHRPPLSPRQVVFGIYTQNTEHVKNHAVRQSPPGGTDRPRVAVSRPSRRSRNGHTGSVGPTRWGLADCMVFDVFSVLGIYPKHDLSGTEGGSMGRHIWHTSSVWVYILQAEIH